MISAAQFQAFRAELEKTAGVPLAVYTGLAGAGLGAGRTWKGQAEQRREDQLLADTEKMSRDVQAMRARRRGEHILLAAALGGAVGAAAPYAIPAAGRFAKKKVKSALKAGRSAATSAAADMGHAAAEAASKTFKEHAAEFGEQMYRGATKNLRPTLQRILGT